MGGGGEERKKGGVVETMVTQGRTRTVQRLNTSGYVKAEKENG